MNKSLNVGNFMFPEILGKTFIINAPWIFSAIWKIAKHMIDKVTQKKISIMSGGYKKELLKFIDPSQLPKKLGGEVEYDEWPIEKWPVMPWTDYQDFCLEQKKFHNNFFY